MIHLNSNIFYCVTMFQPQERQLNVLICFAMLFALTSTRPPIINKQQDPVIVQKDLQHKNPADSAVDHPVDLNDVPGAEGYDNIKKNEFDHDVPAVADSQSHKQKEVPDMKKHNDAAEPQYIKKLGQGDIKELEQLSNKDKPLRLNELQPPDHLDAVRMEQDGHLNRDYKKEIFLGNHEEFERGNKGEIMKKLEDIFHRVDTNSDDTISQAELEEWIVQKVQEHFDEAAEENEKVFRALDTDGDGFITWTEFHVQFLMAKGHPKDKAEKQAEDYETIPLEADDKEQLIRYKFRWADADEDPQDNQLTLEEFKSFRHPEQSSNMMQRMVRDITDTLDRDHDGVVTEEEFVALPPGEVDGEWKDVDRAWQEERRKEFRKVIDLDKNGKVDWEELKTYVDPRNPNHARMESKNLIQLADTNKDTRLSLQEVLSNSDLFLGSKMVNTGRNFHDEF